jgi:hypothetical protein
MFVIVDPPHDFRLFFDLDDPALGVVNAEVEGSIPFCSTNPQGSVPTTSVTNHTGHMGNTFAPKGFSALVIRPVS